jgi:hypothetical protein
MNGIPPQTTPPTPHRSRRWVWFFVVLVVLTFLWLGGLWWRSQLLLLTPERLRQARALWEQRRPRNYNLTYTKGGNAFGTMRVEVRSGKAVAVTLDDRPIMQDDRPLTPSNYGRYDMDGLFDDIESLLELDTKQPKPRALTVAQFSAEDGHLLLYSRQVPASADAPGDSIKISDVKLEVPAGSAGER